MMTHISAEHIAEHEAALTGLLAWAALSADDLIEGMTPDQLRAFVHRMAASKQAQAQPRKVRAPLPPVRKPGAPLETFPPEKLWGTDPLPE